MRFRRWVCCSDFVQNLARKTTPGFLEYCDPATDRYPQQDNLNTLLRQNWSFWCCSLQIAYDWGSNSGHSPRCRLETLLKIFLKLHSGHKNFFKVVFELDQYDYAALFEHQIIYLVQINCLHSCEIWFITARSCRSVTISVNGDIMYLALRFFSANISLFVPNKKSRWAVLIFEQ